MRSVAKIKPTERTLTTANHLQAIIDIDAASKPYREIIRRGLHEFYKEHNQQNSETENKGWLAWLIGEWIKKEVLDQKPIKLSSIIV